MEIKRDKKQFEGYFGNKGITGTRLRYLDWLASKEGKKGIKAVEEVFFLFFSRRKLTF